jgi:D-lactate dehydrogenase
MKVAVFSSRPYVKEYFQKYAEKNKEEHELVFFDTSLNEQTVTLAKGCNVVCLFVNDNANAAVIEKLAGYGIKLIALRCAGFNNVDLEKAEEKGISILRVPAYSPYAVAEHAVALMLALNRKIHKAYNKTREANFTIDGLIGFDVHGKTVGVIGTGQIGAIFAKILKLGFNATVIAYDVFINKELVELGIKYVSLDELYAASDIISLHVPLLPTTNHIVNAESIQKMKDGVMILNTSRGALIDTPATIRALKSGKVGYLGLDVYEEESHLFYEDLSGTVIEDDIISRLLTFPNVIITGHQAFFTREAMDKITSTTFTNINDFIANKTKKENQVHAEAHIAK